MQFDEFIRRREFITLIDGAAIVWPIHSARSSRPRCGGSGCSWRMLTGYDTEPTLVCTGAR